MDCANKERNLLDCNCSALGCNKRGICCECLRKHRDSGELPGCYFDKDAEATWDRSIEHFVKLYIEKNGIPS